MNLFVYESNFVFVEFLVLLTMLMPFNYSIVCMKLCLLHLFAYNAYLLKWIRKFAIFIPKHAVLPRKQQNQKGRSPLNILFQWYGIFSKAFIAKFRFPHSMSWMSSEENNLSIKIKQVPEKNGSWFLENQISNLQTC